MAVSIISLLIACQKSDETQLLFDDNTSDEVGFLGEFVTTEGQTILGDVIDIPYSIENLLKAYENLPAKTKSQINLEDIQPTHYYVRFYPKSIEEQDILRNIKPYVFLSETPLDRKVVVGGSSYHDPSIPEDLPTFQYTVVPVARWAELERTVPVEAEILIKAYIPDYDEAYTTKSEHEYGIPTSAYEALLKEAYRITGNKYEDMPETKASWHPSGRIRAYDDEISAYNPVKGVRIRGTHLLKVKETLTNSQGQFTLESFSNSVSLKIIWESDDWDIRDGLIGQATFDGPQLNNQTWFCDIDTTHQKNVRYAAIHRAAYRYYYDDIGGLARPVIANKLKICQRDTYDIHGGVFNLNEATGLSSIEIFTKNSSGAYKPMNVIFFVAAHELGHAVHYSWTGSDWSDYCGSIKESWGVFTSSILFQKEYNRTPDRYFRWPLPPDNGTSDLHYTPIFLDLYDDINQHDYYTPCPDDEVTGYTPALLNTLLIHTHTLLSLKTKVKQNKPNGVTDEMINTLFNVYEANWIE